MVPPFTETDSGDAVGAAIADLSARLGLTESAITIVSVDDVVWADAALGCPESGVAYAQALIPGLRIVLSAGGTTYDYHAGYDRDPFLCLSPSDPAGSGS